MKVKFVYPSQTELHQPRAYISLGLGYLAATLEEAGVEVEILNLADTSPEKISKDLFQDEPTADWHGITSVSATLKGATKISLILKELGCKVVFGGVAATVEPEFILAESKCDYIIRGEAEWALRDLVLHGNASRIIEAGYIHDLDTLPFPARHLFNESDVIDVTGIHGCDRGVKATTVISSRGCLLRCRFCCKKHPMFCMFRYRSASNVKDELESLIDTYGIEHVRFVDDAFTTNKKRVEKLCEAIEDLGITWVCITRADMMNFRLAQKMEKAGCIETHIGVEYASDRMLELMNKKTNVKVYHQAIKDIKRAGIRVKTYLMYDYPGETKEDREATITFMAKAKPDKFTLSRFTPIPGSEVYTKALYDKNRTYFYPNGNVGWQQYKKQIEEAIK